MSIRIIAQSPQQKSEKQAVDRPPLLLFPRLHHLYLRRAARLRTRAAKNPLGDYMRFAAVIAEAQEIVLYDHPLQMDMHRCLTEATSNDKPPLSILFMPRQVHWQRLLHSLIAEMKPEMDGQALAVIENLEKTCSQELEALASAMLNYNFAKVSSEKAPFIWAALSLYWAQMAALIPGHIRTEADAFCLLCPVCGSVPVCGMVHIDIDDGNQQYLHCNLCESEWLLAADRCSHCGHDHDLHCWSLDGTTSVVKAESCGNCQSYLKLLYQQYDPAAEPIADDLATLILDARMEQEGFVRHGQNPFLFASE